MRPPNSLTKRIRNIHRPNLRTRTCILRQGQRISNNKTTQTALLDLFNSFATQEPMSDNRQTLHCARINENLRGCRERPAGISYVVDKDSDFPCYVADKDHPADVVGYLALFVDQGEVDFQSICYCGCSRIYISIKMDISKRRAWVGVFYLFAPPASGDTMTTLESSYSRFMYSIIVASAYSLLISVSVCFLV